MHWFFLSYARTDDVGTWLSDFFDELALEVRRLAQLDSMLRPSDVGFIDTSGIGLGRDWDPRLLEELQTARAMVCLYSGAYFNQEYCGKEFQVFRSRIERYMRTQPEGTEAPGLILPVLWDPEDWLPKKLPAAAAVKQYKQSDLGALYVEKGLLGLLKQRTRYEAEYQEFKDRFARYLVREARATTLPSWDDVPTRLADVPNAFNEPEAVPPGPEPRTDSGVGGPGTAQFVYVAGRDSELRPYRQRIDSYGEEGRYWRPFAPEIPEPVALIAQRAAVNEGLVLEELPVSQDLLQRLRDAEDKNKIVLFIIDPWTAAIAAYRRRLEEYDRSSFVNCAILVAWNTGDEETAGNLQELRWQLEQTLPRTKIIRSAYLQDSISSADELEGAVLTAIPEVRRNIIRLKETLRPIDDGGTQQLPHVEGPAGGQS
jgi:FxsC-like protein